MRQEIRQILYFIGLGASLVIYAHATFSTKYEVRTIRDILKTIDNRVYDIHLKLVPGRKQ